MRNRTTLRTMFGVLIVALGLSAPGTSRAAQNTTAVPQQNSSFTVYTWGDPDGHPGAQHGLQHNKPTPVNGIPQPVIQIATSNSDTYALTSRGTVYAWGAGVRGELGNGGTTHFTGTPTLVQFPPGVTIASLANTMPFDTGLAIDSGGNVWGWGFDHQSELCLSSESEALRPVELPFTDVTLASGAGGHALFYSSGRVYACGVNSNGELGNGTTKNSPTPTLVSGLPFDSVQALVSSWQGSGALLSYGAYYDWGHGRGGQLGDGRTANSAVPVLVDLPTTVTQVAQGGSDVKNGQTVALLSDGSVWSWGNGEWGQLGDGLVADTSSPVQVLVPIGVAFTQVGTGGATSYAIDGNGNLWAWGDNNVGQLGVGGATAWTSTPISVGVVLNEVSSTAANVAGLIITSDP